MTKEYKMLWFAVDRPHRQRYFCICGFKQTVTKPRSRLRKEKNLRYRKSPRFSVPARLFPPQILAEIRLRDRYSKKSLMEINR